MYTGNKPFLKNLTHCTSLNHPDARAILLKFVGSRKREPLCVAVAAVRLLAWIILAGDMEVFTERGATLFVSSPRRRPRIKPSFVAPPESLDKLLADR